MDNFIYSRSYRRVYEKLKLPITASITKRFNTAEAIEGFSCWYETAFDINKT
jgi:hypothetical protein